MTGRTVAPGIGFTAYDPGPGSNLLPLLESPEAEELLRASDHVTLHTHADASDVRAAQQLRARHPHLRVWLACPGNYLSALDLARGRAAVLLEVSRVARIATDAAAEVLEWNGEGASSGTVAGDWTSAAGDSRERARLATLGTAVLQASRMGFKGALAWTSHDGVRSFAVPRSVLGHVELHAPQHYPAAPGQTASQRTLERRVAWSAGQWDVLVREGACPPATAPWGAQWSPYLQGHGHTLGALVWGLSIARTARLWAFPRSWDHAVARDALRLARALRARVGFGPSAVEEWQTSQGLEPDGVVGPRTLRSLELVTGS